MKKHILMLVVLFSTTVSAASENSAIQNEFSLQAVIDRASCIEFDKGSPRVSEAYIYFIGQNILSAKDVQYARWFHEGQCSIEILYALYVSLHDCWLSEDGQRFIPEDLNGGHTIDNYQFLKAVFADGGNALGQ